MSTTPTPLPVTFPNPTANRYQCGSGCGAITFSWDRHTPDGGRLGMVTFGQFVNKPIQVYDAKPLPYLQGRPTGTNWGFQAQDGSFVGRMYVSTYQCFIRFVHFRPNDKWPQVSCHTPTPDSRDTNDIDKVA